ncbi:hypothetical protein [Paenibacillus silvae]|uniref:hypothetical protein n=1 Tax=Paenibacillus silvae TaxID=1325358 RepID=UPI00200310B2|nr:hypothetical protein [Paenibacillus silvae]MCK6074597.1 hypothetical protein [Paenibacillus silvae]MCK6147927.1 hypothetical protein [Paenibacillus silvae]MCK6266225.1 hypothetical protein [Paenibacillus silvae]
MNEVELLKVYGVEPDQKHRESIRQLLRQEIEEPEGEDNEVLKLLCIMLFAVGNVEDTELIWRAKRKNQDTGSYIDVQLLCGAGLEETLVYLEHKQGDHAHEEWLYLKQCEPYDFVDFSKDQWLAGYKAYYNV